jgi:hypothetical protein
MKKSILVLAVGCVLAAALPGQVLAQGNKNDISFSGAQSIDAPVHVVPFTYHSLETADKASLEASTINVKAIKDFKDRFANAKDEKWYAVQGGLMTYFSLDGFGNRAFYDKKGHWLSSLKFFGEDKLPTDVRATVKSSYYDFSITVVELIEVPGHFVYVIHLENAANIKIVRVSEEGEMDVLQEYTKA